MGKSRNRYEERPMEFTEEEKEEIHNAPRLGEIREWLKRLQGKREGMRLTDASFATVASNVMFMLARDRERERLVAYYRDTIASRDAEIKRLKTESLLAIDKARDTIKGLQSELEKYKMSEKE
jgi:hypothetical protein